MKNEGLKLTLNIGRHRREALSIYNFSMYPSKWEREGRIGKKRSTKERERRESEKGKEKAKKQKIKRKRKREKG